MQYELKASLSERVYSKTSTEDNNGSNGSAFTDIAVRNSNASGRYATEVRKSFADFFMTSRAVEWQWEKALSNDF